MTARKDFTQIALAVVQQATGELAAPAPTPKQRAARKGGLKGGKGRMAALTEEQRRELAEKAARARWGEAAPVPPGPGAVKR